MGGYDFDLAIYLSLEPANFRFDVVSEQPGVWPDRFQCP